MTMFDAVRNSKKVTQIFLALITLPFAFFGVDAYLRNSGAEVDFANVGGIKISAQRFDQALRERQETLQNSLGENFRPDMMNLPEVRRSVLDTVINRQLLRLEASKKNLTVSNEMLLMAVSQMPMLQENGQFSSSRYAEFLRTQPNFEAQLQQSLLFQQLLGAFEESSFVSEAQIDELFKAQFEERQFAEFKVAAEPFLAQVKIEPAALKKYYDEHQSQFEVAEQVKLDYVILSPEALLPQIKVGEAEIKAWFDSHADRYQQEEQRRVSQILILPGAGDEARAAAKLKIEDLLKQVQAAPTKFAELAKQYSEDPNGSGQKGGDVGYFGRGMMTQPFEDAAFAQKEGQISDIIESEAGFHIIQLTGIQPAKKHTLGDVRTEIEKELKQQAAERKFAELRESFSASAYDEMDSLQPAATLAGVPIQHADWLTKNPTPQQMASLGPVAHASVLSAVFASEAIKDKHNTKAIDVASNTLLSARVVEYQPATLKTLESVSSQIETRLKNQDAAALAKKSGEEIIAKLSSGEDKLKWSTEQNLSRVQARNGPAALQAVFKAGTEKLPSYAGASNDSDYLIYKISKASLPEKSDEAARKALKAEYSSILSQEDMSAYLSSLRQRYKVTINTAALEVKQ